MTSDSLAVHEPDLAERPTPAAQLKITAQPARVKITARRWWLTAEGTVPPAEARHLIGAFGVLGCVTMGITGAVLTLHVSSRLTVLALAELVLALAGAGLITVCGLARDHAGQRKGAARQEGT